MTGMCSKISLLLMSVVVGLTACKRQSQDLESDTLMEVETLRQLMDDGENLMLIDVRPKEDYDKNHLPGAINIWRTEVEEVNLPYRGMTAYATHLSGLLGSKGIQSGQLLVLYDDRGGVEAARIWWMLKRFGHEKSAVLNGGLQAWGSPVTAEVVQVAPTKFVFSGTAHPEVTIDFDAFERLRRNPGVRVIDNRSAVEFSGEEMKNGAFMAGHIPGAQNFCYSNAINFEPDGKMKLKTLKELEALYGPMAQKNDTVLLYCHSGVRSAHTYFVLTELLGYQHVYNYDGSWIEWSYKNQPIPADSLQNEQQSSL